jgi:hypothetical protein
MTDTTPAPHPSTVTTYPTMVPENPWTKALGGVGASAIILGFILLLLPADDSYGSSSLDLVRLLAGTGIISIGGTLTTCALLLAGMGWYVREQTRKLTR